jgi:hypothetical protein
MSFLPEEYRFEYKSGTHSEKFEKYINSIYGSRLSSGANTSSSHYGFMYQNMIKDETTLYRHNEFGYRSDSWDGSHEVLALGCSHTYGRGIVEEGRWTNILQELSNKKIANLSSPGQSINFLVSKAFEYFKTFGNPEYVICLFPDPLRINLPTDSKLIDSKRNNKNINTVVYVSTNESLDERPNYLKKPYYYEDVLPVEVPIYFSMQALYALEQYCNANKIKLIWSSWDPMFQDVICYFPQISFTNFISNDLLKVNDSTFYADCHSSYKERFDYYFIHGRDDDNINHTHPGVHKNIHIAEIFYEEMKRFA